MKKRASQANKRTAIIRLRATEAEAREIISGADIAELSLSEFCRRRILGRRISARIDDKTIAELRKIGGLLKKNFLEGNGTDDTKNILNETKKAIERIAHTAES